MYRLAGEPGAHCTSERIASYISAPDGYERGSSTLPRERGCAGCLLQKSLRGRLSLTVQPQSCRKSHCMATEIMADRSKTMDVLYSTFVLNVEPGKDYESLLYHVQTNTRIRFTFHSSFFGQSISIYTTYEPDDPAIRSSIISTNNDVWYPLKLHSGSANRNDDFGRYAELHCLKPGSYKFCMSLEASGSINRPEVIGYFHVLSRIAAGLPVDAIACQSVYARLLGHFSGWTNQFSVAQKSGYNMIHLSPVQKLGRSRQPRCISEQLELNDEIFGPNSGEAFELLEKFIGKIEKEWNMFTMGDLVLAETAVDSPWINDHPECTYNLENTPHLRPAYLLDRVLCHFSRAVASGEYAQRGLSNEPWTENAITTMKSILLDEVYPKTRIHELFQVNVEELVKIFKEKVEAEGRPSAPPAEQGKSLRIIQDLEYHRLSSKVDMDLAMALFNQFEDKELTEAERQQKCLQKFRECLWSLNNEAAQQCWDHLRCGVENLANHLRMQQEKARPKASEKHPLFPQYFLQLEASTAWEQDEERMHSVEKRRRVMLKNVWVPNEAFFQTATEFAFFRRDLHCCGYTVKLRYGNCPKDCEYIWERMTKYTRSVAKLFHAINIVDVPSMPLQVCEHMTKEIRRIRPNAFICATLDVNNTNTRRIVNRLGITAVMQSTATLETPYEIGSLIRRFGGKPIGSFVQPPLSLLSPSDIPIMLFDMTLDDESPVRTRTPLDILPTASLLAAAGHPYGSCRGIDELVLNKIDASTEQKRYRVWSDEPSESPGYLDTKVGIIHGRQAINRLHAFLSRGEFNEVQVEHNCENMIVVHKRSQLHGQCVILAVRNCFCMGDIARREFVSPVVITGNLQEILYEGTLQEKKRPRLQNTPTKLNNETCKENKLPRPRYVKGLNKYELFLKEMVSLFDSATIEIVTRTQSSIKEVDFIRFRAGAVIAMLVTMPKEHRIAISTLRKELARIDVVTFPPESVQEIQDFRSTAPDLKSILHAVSLSDYNRVLFRCENEQVKDELSMGAYEVPGIGKLPYCGLYSIIHHLNKMRLSNDMEHPLCHHLRQGNWLPDYITKRLLIVPGTKNIAEWLQFVFDVYKELPTFAKPCYFEAIVSGAYRLMTDAILSKMSNFVQNGGPFVRALAISSLMFCGSVSSGKLPELSSYVQSPKQEVPAVPVESNQMTTIAAGIPNYAAGLQRNWSRDTFIALRGLLLIPGRYSEARYIILSYSGLVKNGQMPSRVYEHTNVQFGSRDTVWWWLLAIKHYVEMVPNGQEIMWDPVIRYSPKEKRSKRSCPADQFLFNAMQEAINTVFQGRKRRGLGDRGPELGTGVDMETGFVFGGNARSAGTWMDKIGSSQMCNNTGVPATPRDGSAVEIVAISYAIIKWLSKMAKGGQYPYAGVRYKHDNKEVFWTWETWASKVMGAFENNFWIPSVVRSEEAAANGASPGQSNTGFYKDVVNSEIKWSETQLRPNFLIAMAVAPELFNTSNARTAIEKAEAKLLGRLGMKTLNEEDWAYNGYYSPSIDSADYKTARGFNLHQGPEWVWLTGYFLRAKMHMAVAEPAFQSCQSVVSRVKQILANHWEYINNDPWFSLPEFTNKDGAPCPDACPAQAKSIGCIMEVLYDLSNVMKDNQAL
uniref:4-alpha-glucanotransferase n=1 Tax=Trichuris muris TaxID=70415 RepID=A0A5S6QS88_TRIMR